MKRSPSSRGRGLKSIIPSFAPFLTVSPSSRGRGLKFSLLTLLLSFHWSPSSRGRGLKLDYKQGKKGLPFVALFTRAWIEIFATNLYYLLCLVALFTRAWIEIEVAQFLKSDYFGRPLHEGVD